MQWTSTARRNYTVSRFNDRTTAPKKRNLGTLFKNHENKIREQRGARTSIFRWQHIHIKYWVTKEVYKYLSASRLDFEEDPLLWWKTQPFNYPILGKVARKYLCVCATSSASERLFSTASNVVSSFRSTLKPDKVDMLEFLSKNLAIMNMILNIMILNFQWLIMWHVQCSCNVCTMVLQLYIK